MTNKFMYLVTMLLIFQVSFAQDIIVTKDSKRIDAKIEEIGTTEIKYRKANNPNGPLFVMLVSEVESIIYENGEVQSFSQSSKVKKESTTYDDKRQEVKNIKSIKSLTDGKLYHRWFGFSVGYVWKNLESNMEQTGYSGSSFGFPNFKYYGNTLQIGFTFNPTFKYGLGLYTGLYYEHTFADKMTWNLGANTILGGESSGSQTYSEYKEDYNNSAHGYNKDVPLWFKNYTDALFLPLHLQYKKEFVPEVAILVSAGFSFEFAAKKYTRNINLDGTYQDVNWGWKTKVQTYAGGRIGFQIYGVQITATTDWALYKVFGKKQVRDLGVSSEDYINSLPNNYGENLTRPISVQLTYFF